MTVELYNQFGEEIFQKQIHILSYPHEMRHQKKPQLPKLGYTRTLDSLRGNVGVASFCLHCVIPDKDHLRKLKKP